MTDKIFSIDEIRLVLESARNAGIKYIAEDNTTRATDDQDCYPRSIHITVDKLSPIWPLLKLLEKEYPWLKVDRRGRTLYINSSVEIPFRLQELGYKQTVVNVLNESGISCYLDVGWR